MPQPASDSIPIGATLHGPHWPSPVRVVRVEPRGNARVLVEAVTLDGGVRLLSRLFRHEELVGLQIEREAGRPTLDGDPLGFRLAAEAPRVLGVAAIVPATTSASVIPSAGEGPPMRRSDAVEAAAMVHAAAYEQARGWQAEDVSEQGLGYDLLSRGPGGEVRYVEVKGRAGVGAVELSANEWLKAEQLGEDYWLYVVTDALTAPEVHPVRDPAHRLPGEEVVPQVRYRVTEQGWHRVAESAHGYTVHMEDSAK